MKIIKQKSLNCHNCGTEICEKCNFDQNKKEYVLRGESYENQ